MREIIELENVSYDYESGDEAVHAVKNVSLKFKKGEFVVLLGHNGSGKSTLAKLLNGFLAPSSGEVFVKEMNTKDEDKTFEIRKEVGMVFQNPDNQMVATIIEDDIAFGPENLGVDPKEIRERVDWALKAVKMYEYKDHTPFKLSGGQKQRIAIAAILAMLPSVLILDESTAMLDPAGRGEVLETVKTLNREKGMTVILITHYMDEAIGADRVVVMADGELVGDGVPEEVFADEGLIERANLVPPVAVKISHALQKAGVEMKTCLTDAELAEELCRFE